MPLARLVERALVSYLATDSSNVAENQLIADLIARVEKIEGQLAAPPPSVPSAPAPTPPPKQPAQNRQQGGSSPVQVPEHPTGEHPKANGGRWLSTTDAVAVSASRGGPDNTATLKRWGERGQLEALGLRYCPHGTKRNDLASFEDLRSQG